MTTKRMTGIDYRREWHLIRQQEKSLKAHVQERLSELIKLYPEAEVPILTINGVEIAPCKELFINEISTFGIIGYIEKIEAWSAEQQPVIQTKIKL